MDQRHAVAAFGEEVGHGQRRDVVVLGDHQDVLAERRLVAEHVDGEVDERQVAADEVRAPGVGARRDEDLVGALERVLQCSRPSEVPDSDSDAHRGKSRCLALISNADSDGRGGNPLEQPVP